MARVSPATAAAAGLADGDKVTVESATGSVTVPVAVTEMADGVVWLPSNSTGSAVRADLLAGRADGGELGPSKDAKGRRLVCALEP